MRLTTCVKRAAWWPSSRCPDRSSAMTSRHAHHRPQSTVATRSRSAAEALPYRSLAIVASCAALAAGIAGVLSYCDALMGVPPEKLVTVYRTHGCQCAYSWSRELEARGYWVRVWEVETLAPVRHRLHTPEQLDGCHVAQYLGYFVEGHVPASDLERLRREHPDATGIAQSVAPNHPSGTADAAAVPVASPPVLFDAQGHSLAWKTTQRTRS